MARFAPSKYDPHVDSSKGAPKDGTLHITFPNRPLKTKDGTPVLEDGKPVLELGCRCGCGSYPSSTKSRFLMGHDARLKGKLIRAHLTGTKVTTNGVVESAAEAAATHGWTEQLRQAEQRAGATTATKRVAVRKPPKSLVGKTRMVRIGRWFYDAKITGQNDELGTFSIEYKTKQGEIKTATIEKGDIMSPPAPDAQARREAQTKNDGVLISK